jgi:predicted ATPase
MNKKQKKIVLTGAPGTGKSTIISALEKLGYTCLHEISRDIILEAREKGTEQLFLTEPLLFSDLLLKGREEQYHKATELEADVVFFDRGIPDVHAYMNYIGMDYPERFLTNSKKNRYDYIFLMPPWEDIYTTDNERYETFEQSLAIHNHLLRTYNSLGYSVVEVPKGSVEKRTAYILDVINTFK